MSWNRYTPNTHLFTNSEDVKGTRVIFDYSSGGDQSWTVPTGVTQIYAKVWGAGGGPGSPGGWSYGSPGGGGGFAAGIIPVTAGESLLVAVGQCGYLRQVGVGAGARGYGGGAASCGNGSDNNYGGGGGGYSGIFRTSKTQGNAIIMAGGGGGGGSQRTLGNGNNGGAGGGLTGERGYAAFDNRYSYGGGGGTQTGAGTQASTDGGGTDAGTGTALAGGFARTNSYGGGGGGGYFGGSGGGYNEQNTMGGGGGGSGYLASTVLNGVLIGGVGSTPGNFGDWDIQSMSTTHNVRYATGGMTGGNIIQYGGMGLVIIRY